MNIERTSLVLEGGAMRGSFTAGVVSFLLEKQITFPYVIGISAGASNALNYISKQKQRARICFVDLVNDPRYYGVKHFIRGNGLFNTRFLYDEMPMKVLPYDYNEFFASDVFFKLGAVHARSAQIRYWARKDIKTPCDLNLRLRASSSMPIVMPMTGIDGEEYVDGGVVDSIPIDEAIRDGNNKHVVVLTQRRGYRKQQQKPNVLSDFRLRNYPLLREALLNRHVIYNKTLERIAGLEEEGKAFVIAPEREPVGRMELNVNKLMNFYEHGYKQAENLLPAMAEFLE